jgi:hypothetical protein
MELKGHKLDLYHHFPDGVPDKLAAIQASLDRIEKKVDALVPPPPDPGPEYTLEFTFGPVREQPNP